MNPNYGLMVELKPNFQKELFSKLLKEYGRFELSSLLKRAPSILYHYKNCRVKSLDLELAYKSLKLAKIRKSSLKYNILRIYSAVEDRRKIFDSGIQARMNQIQIQFNSKCSLNNFIDKEGDVLYINIKKWFIKTKWIDRIKNQVGIINWISGPIFKGGKVILEYEVYKRSKNKMEKFVTELPEKLEINEEFMYFLGMRYGDGTSNARIGVVNKNLTLLSYISKYLKKIFPNNKIQGLLYLYKKDLDKELLDKIKIYLEELVDEFQIIINKKMKGDYVAAVFVINNFFDKIYIKVS
nr:hypothetical protein [Candidatus Woesearchaeota archaeon]